MVDKSEHVLITGVSSGIGEGLAIEYLQRGASVWGVSRRPPAAGLEQHPQFFFRPLDLVCESEVGPGLAELLGGCQRLDTVVLNAGAIGRMADMEAVSLGELRALMDINVWANKRVLDALFRQPLTIRRVIGISSGAAVNGKRGWNGYAISKSALNMLIQLYAREQPDTWFASVAPGLVDTAMQEYLCSHPPDDRFESLEVLRSHRGTDQMPTPGVVGTKLRRLFDRIESTVESGGFVDIRQFQD
ncbi:MAG: SDR family NAD(P)-dependent oxidoreductase [Mariniblastus sp.]|nr:SDR family NAD(P)-dependent oxidoreductase [Mariniblastus sp.]